jgi:hypothetical protein
VVVEVRLPAGVHLGETELRFLIPALRLLIDDPPPVIGSRFVNALRAIELECAVTVGLPPHGRREHEPVTGTRATRSATLVRGMNDTTPTAETTNVEVAADRLGVTSQHVRRLAAKGAFPGASRLGGGSSGPWLIPTAALALYERTRP